MPCLVIVPLLNGFLALLFSTQVLRGRWRVSLALCGAALFIASLGTTLPRVKAWAVAGRDRQQRGKELADRSRECKDCMLIGSYGSSAGNAALAFGNGYSNWINGKVLSDLYPNTIYYDIFGRQFLSFTNENREAEVRSWLSEGRKILLQGSPMSAANKYTPAGFALRPVEMEGSEILYAMSAMETSHTADAPPANAILIAAAAMHAGTAIIDRTEFGIGLPVVRTLTVPTAAEYSIQLPAAGRYELRGRCASEAVRPVTVSANGRKLTESFCALSTGGYYPQNQEWQSSGIYEFPKGNTYSSAWIQRRHSLTFPR